MIVRQGTLLAVAIACCGMAFAADEGKDAGSKGTKKPSQTSSSAAPARDAGKANTAGPGVPLADVPLKDLKIVAPDSFSAKDSKIIGQPDKMTLGTTPIDSKKPILAAPPSGSAAVAPAAASK